MDDERQADRAGILVVDDLPDKLLTFATVLEELQQDVVTVRSGRDALREVLRRDFAVILLDVNMPDIDGFETAEMIRGHRRSAHTPIIFITAYADEMQTARGYSLGAVDYILSPVVPEVLRSKVRVFVALHEMQRQVRRQAEDRAAMTAAENARRAAERHQARSAFLADASRVLGGALDADTVGVRPLAELIVPARARVALVALADEAGGFDPVCLATAADPAAAQAVDLRPMPLAELEPSLREALLRAARERLRCTLATVEAAPMLAGDRLVGVLAAVDVRDLDGPLLDELAGRAAAAFENARLYRSLRSEVDVRMAAQARLQAADRRKDEYLAMLAHELRNPLAAIRSALEVVRLESAGRVKVDRAAGIMDRQLRHMTRLMEDLLDVARISQDKIVLAREALDLRAIVAQSVESLRPLIDARRQRIVVTQPPDPVQLHGDAARLTQIVSNLLHNAAKFSGPDTQIEVHCGIDADGSARVSVRDYGAGIDADLLPHVFELFEQGKRGLAREQGGLGIGLTLARRLAEMHGGSLDASSDGPDRGSEFRLRLPRPHAADAGPAPAATLTPAPVRTPPAQQRVLVVDDNEDAAFGLATYLDMCGHDVATAGDGLAALTQAQALRPDVVIVDIGLPLLDGYQVARRLRAMTHVGHPLLIALTGYGQAQDRSAALAAGFDHHFAKPADLAELAAVIESGRDAA